MESGLLGEMAGCRTRVENIRDEPGAPLVLESKEVLKNQQKQNKNQKCEKRNKTHHHYGSIYQRDAGTN